MAGKSLCFRQCRRLSEVFQGVELLVDLRIVSDQVARPPGSLRKLLAEHDQPEALVRLVPDPRVR